MNTPEPEFDEDDTAALLCGMARWRLAVNTQRFDQLEQSLPNYYLCVDTDIISMYGNPASGAGYLGLLYYGQASRVVPRGGAEAANLAASLAQFILFELEGRQTSADPRLVLPGHAEEIQRSYQKARERADSEMQRALRELSKFKQAKQAIVDSLKDTDATPNNLAEQLQKFAEDWIGNGSADPSKPTGLAAIEQAERYGELFSVMTEDNRHPVSERLQHVSQFRFGQPLRTLFLPDIAIGSSERLAVRARSLEVDARHMDRVVREIEDGLDEPIANYDKEMLTAGTDAYVLAWLDIVSRFFSPSHSGARAQLKLITGSERMAQHAPNHVISPIALMGIYLQSRLSAAKGSGDTQAHSAVARLKGALDAVLNPLAFEDGYYGATSFLEWCQIHSSYEKSLERARSRGMRSTGVEEVLKAWAQVANLFASSQGEYSRQSRQSIISQLKKIDPEITEEDWREAISKNLKRAERQLLLTATKLALMARSEVKALRSRNPLPLRLESNPIAQDVAGRLIWQYAFDRSTIYKEEFVEKVNQLDDADYFVLLLGGLLLCATGDWRAARTYFDAAVVAADEEPQDRGNDGIEGSYAHGVACHVGAVSFADLDTARNSLSRARARLMLRDGPGAGDIRFDTEDFSIELVELWGRLISRSNESAVEPQARAVSLASNALETFNVWRQRGSDVKEGDYVLQYCLQEMACTALQAYWISRLALDGQQLQLRLSGASAAHLQEPLKGVAEWLRAHCEESDRDSEHEAPMVSALVRVTSICAAKILHSIEPDPVTLKLAQDLCNDRANFAISLIDEDRYRFFKQILNTRTVQLRF